MSQLKAQIIRQGHGHNVAQGVWQFQANGGSWMSFAPEFSEKIMEAFLKGQSEFVVQISGVPYTEDFDDMLQTNHDTGKERPIRCNFGLPSHWSSSNEAIFGRLPPKAVLTNDRALSEYESDVAFRGRIADYDTDASDDPMVPRHRPTRRKTKRDKLTFDSVTVRITDGSKLDEFTKLLRESVFHHEENGFSGDSQCDVWKRGFRVREAFHVENVSLFKAYMDNCHRMRRRHDDHEIAPEPISPGVGGALELFSEGMSISTGLSESVQERMLFHGTTLETAQKIVLDGFDSRLSNTGGFYGMGTYFASQTCKSAQYGFDGTIILARVALGDPHYTARVDQQLRRPPTKAGHTICCDSVIARPGPMRGHHSGTQSHQEFVIFEQMQAYPEYVLRYDCE